MGTSRAAARINTATNLRIWRAAGADSTRSPLEIGDCTNADSGESILLTYCATKYNGPNPSQDRPTNKIRLSLQAFGSESTAGMSAYAKLFLAAATTPPAAA